MLGTIGLIDIYIFLKRDSSLQSSMANVELLLVAKTSTFASEASVRVTHECGLASYPLAVSIACIRSQ